jgi:hypothetical protein
VNLSDGAKIGDPLLRPTTLKARTTKPLVRAPSLLHHPKLSSVMSNGGDDLDLGALGVRVLKELHALLLSSVGAVARPPP